MLTVDGQPAKWTFPSSHTGAGPTLRYNTQEQIPDVIPESNEKRVAHLGFPLGMHANVFHWSDYMVAKYEPK